jgi:hypothetical protein
MRRTLFVLTSLAASSPATAAALPKFDIAAFCARIGTIGMTQSTAMLDGCIQAEAAARADLADTWTSVAPDVQTHCATAAGFAGDGSYALMQGCIARLRAEQVLDAGN